jgi:hypothetical protein
VFRIIFAPNRDEVTGGWRKLNNVELHNLYSSPNIIRAIKSGKMSWAGQLACTGIITNAYIFVKKPEEKRTLGIHSVDGRIILKQTLLKKVG